MVYFNNEDILIRDMTREDAEALAAEECAKGDEQTANSPL